MQNEPARSPINFSLKSLAVGVLCIVAMQMILLVLQGMVTLPFSEQIQRSIATAFGVLAWFYVGGKLGT